ncbi:MAG TPA: aldo/keto reductase [Anaerolineae bacterium]|nr:MAG: alcohol dehydrogenase [Anaerolineae bacterium SM23_ 63]HEY42829.1 aldo/keto reductase [Anaerolineae bacterium]
MEYRHVGKTGLMVSELCLGTMQFGWTADETTSFEVLTAAYESGINFLDTADIYSSWVEGNPGGVAEMIIGRWLNKGIAARDQVVIATKVRGRMGEGPNDEGLSRGHILAAAEASLRRMDTDYIDLYQVHWPDESTPIDETLSALDDLVRRGDVRYIGCSNFPSWRLMQALWTSDRRNLVRFSSLQPHYNLLHRGEYERELEDVCQTYGLGVLPYSPLARGFLTGKYRRDKAPEPGSRGASSESLKRYMSDDRSWHVLEVLEKLAVEREKTVSQMALSWLLSRHSVTSPIIGPRTVMQLEDNLGAIGLRLDPIELAEIESVSDWRKI